MRSTRSFPAFFRLSLACPPLVLGLALLGYAHGGSARADGPEHPSAASSEEPSAPVPSETGGGSSPETDPGGRGDGGERDPARDPTEPRSTGEAPSVAATDLPVRDAGGARSSRTPAGRDTGGAPPVRELRRGQLLAAAVEVLPPPRRLRGPWSPRAPPAP